MCGDEKLAFAQSDLGHGLDHAVQRFFAEAIALRAEANPADHGIDLRGGPSGRKRESGGGDFQGISSGIQVARVHWFTSRILCSLSVPARNADGLVAVLSLQHMCDHALLIHHKFVPRTAPEENGVG